MKRSLLLAIAMLLAVVLAAGCSGSGRTTRGPILPAPDGTLAVAGFTAPQHTWELLAGYLPHEGESVPRDVLMQLDNIIYSVLTEHAVVNYMNPAVVEQCAQVVDFEQTTGSRTSAWKYWLTVGQCIPADYLLVPQLLYWRERVGSDSGVSKPASVVLDLYLIDVKAGRLAGRFHFDETQQSLSANFLNAAQFAARGSRWITAGELSREGIEAGLTELGL